MNTTDSSFIITLLILPSLFGLTLIGEGVNKIMNYDNHGWVTLCSGSAFVIVLIIAFFIMSTRALS